MFNIKYAFVLFSLTLMGCSTHPLPYDVTRETTTAIVQHIRCEGREALDNLTVELLRRHPDPYLTDYANRIESHTLHATDLIKYKENFHLERLDDTQIREFVTYTLSAVTFDFSFTMSEMNDNSTNFDLSVPFVSRVASINGMADAKFQRQNIRKFLVTNSFFELHELTDKYCAETSAIVGNVLYPITGRIGLQEVFKTFIDIDSTAGSTKAPDSTHLFTDQLLFTTTLTASVTPKITLNPLASGVNPTSGLLRVPDAAVTLSAQRIDAHQVAISIARGDLLESYTQALKQSALYSIKKARSNAKQKSVAIAQQNRVDFFFINQQNINNRLNIISPY